MRSRVYNRIYFDVIRQRIAKKAVFSWGGHKVLNHDMPLTYLIEYGIMRGSNWN